MGIIVRLETTQQIFIHVDMVQCIVSTHGREREEGDGEHGEAGGHDLAGPGQRHRVPVPDGRHRDLRRYVRQLQIILDIQIGPGEPNFAETRQMNPACIADFATLLDMKSYKS